ncbi:MAG: DUF421 domain-containing protein [Syntrophales bacterium]|jgi:uncharacterized membrane protein YcaP (DUF421 family)|nr:DUF421 domain-containing protein [Syntrophales bacterium]MDY0044892.1 DUF421 domain-containing protein [Syntrophales bacterium]
MEKAFFDGWSVLVRTAVVGVLAYIILVILLRITGKRTLSKMNAFDFVITIALGSTLATILLSRNVALAQGALALALLVILQYIITWSSVRARWVKKLVTGEPSLLAFRGKFLSKAMRRSRVTEDEIRTAVRSAGISQMTEAEAVVLETDGSFSIVKRGGGSENTSLTNIKMPVQEERK